MYEVKGDKTFIDVITSTMWDSNMNNYAGGHKLEIDVIAGPALIDMQQQLSSLQARIDTIYHQQDMEARLRKENPALQDIHNKYQIVYELVKKNDGGTNGG